MPRRVAARVLQHLHHEAIGPRRRITSEFYPEEEQNPTHSATIDTAGTANSRDWPESVALARPVPQILATVVPG